MFIYRGANYPDAVYGYLFIVVMVVYFNLERIQCI